MIHPIELDNETYMTMKDDEIEKDEVKPMQ